jgi:hypothetical protein
MATKMLNCNHDIFAFVCALPFGIHGNLGLKLDDGNGGSFANS